MSLRFCSALVATALITVNALALDVSSIRNIDINQVWLKASEAMSEQLGKLLVIKDAPDQTPALSWRADKEDLRHELDDSLNEVIGILGDGKLPLLKKQITADLNLMGTANRDLIRVKELSVVAKDNGGLKKWIGYCPKELSSDTSKLCLDNKRVELEKSVKEAQARVVQNRQTMVEVLKGMNLPFNDAQVSTLIYTVTGDDEIALYTLFDSVKQMTAVLKDRMAQSGEDVTEAQKYFGMYTMLVRIVKNVQQGYYDRIQNRYLRNLAKMRVENAKQIDKITTLLYGQEDSDTGGTITNAESVVSLRASLDALNLNSRAMDVYETYLKQVSNRLAQAIQITEQQYIAAEVRFFTVNQSAALQAMMGASRFDAVMNMRAPAMEAFKNAQLAAKIQEFSGKLAAE